MLGALRAMTVPERLMTKMQQPSAESRRFVGNPLAAAAGGAVALAPIIVMAAGITAAVYVTAVVIDKATTATMDAFDEHREKMRCKKVLEKCIAKCSEETLPTGDLGGDAFHKCRKECLDAENCWGVNLR